MGNVKILQQILNRVGKCGKKTSFLREQGYRCNAHSHQSMDISVPSFYHLTRYLFFDLSLFTITGFGEQIFQGIPFIQNENTFAKATELFYSCNRKIFS